jgi:hypothetical protein
MHFATVVLAAQALAGTVDLVWVDPTNAAPFAYLSATAESTEILQEAGVDARWRRGTPTEVLRPDEVAVVLLPGTAPQSQPDHRVMGASQTGEDAVAAVWIYVPEVRWTLDLERVPMDAWTGAQRNAFGRALGRVAAHETVHALLPRLPHAASGLMSERIDRTTLLARRIAVDRRTRSELLLIRGGKPLESMYLSAKTHLSATSPSLHGPTEESLLPSAPCHTSSDPFRRVAPATSPAETQPATLRPAVRSEDPR